MYIIRQSRGPGLCRDATALSCGGRKHGHAMPTLAILDDDHILRLVRYAIAGDGEVTQAWAEGFFLPEAMDTAQVRAAGDGLHAADGVPLLPLGADVRTGGDLDVLIVRRGT